MNGWFIFALILLGLAVAAGATAPFLAQTVKDRHGDSHPRFYALATAAVLSFFGISFVMIASAYSVPVRNVGIVTSFNKPTGEVTGSGLHWVKPWQKVNDFDASIQTSDHTGDKHCTTVRIGSLATACVENKVRWQVVETAAPKLYTDYKADFDNMRVNLFEAELQRALNEEFATYNPLASIDLNTGAIKFDLNELAESVRTNLSEKLGGDITVHSVVIPLIRHDGKTEENIKAFQDVLAENRVLTQKKANAEVEKQTAAVLASVPDTYVINKCLDIAKELGKEPGFCLGGGNPVQLQSK